MKVTLEKDYKKHYTIEDLAIAKAIIKDMKEDVSSVKEYLQFAVSDYIRKECGWTEAILTAEATTAMNSRVWNAYGVEYDSQHMDVWIEGLAKVYGKHGEAYIEIGAYLTDIWSISSDESMADHYYVRRFNPQG